MDRIRNRIQHLLNATKCPDCDGFGWHPAEYDMKVDCDCCGGTGMKDFERFFDEVVKISVGLLDE